MFFKMVKYGIDYTEDMINELEEFYKNEYELDEELYDYYYKLWQGYDNWIQEYYTLSEIVVIDIDKYDYVNNQEDKKEVLKLITDALNTINE